MNIRRGLFRIWLVASVLFVLCVAGFSYNGIRQEFRNASTDWGWDEYMLLPVDCEKARGASGANYEVGKDDGLCWYKVKEFRRLYPEYKDLQTGTLSEKLYAKVGRPLKKIHPWRKVMETAGIALGGPLAVLALGASLLWAFAGFRGSRERPK